MHADPEILARLEFARHAAWQAQGFILKHFSPRGVRFDSKSDGSPVTAGDVGAEELVRGLIAKAWPADGIIGEECGVHAGRSDFRWVIDPIDGTRSFIHGVPLFGTLIGVQKRATPGDPRALDGWRCVAGVVRCPALNESAWAALGAGAWHEWPIGGGGEPATPQRIAVSTTARLADASVSTTTPQAMLGAGEVSSGAGARRFYESLNARVKLSRGWSDCYGFMLVATGRIDAMIDPPMKLWDVAALEPLVLEAGGELTGWNGQPTDGTTGAIASNGRVHAEILSLLNG